MYGLLSILRKKKLKKDGHRKEEMLIKQCREQFLQILSKGLSVPIKLL